jgi:hypothetical protein
VSKKATKSEFVAQWSNASFDALRAAAKEYGHVLKASTKGEAVDECYDLYSGKLKPDASALPAPAVSDVPAVSYEGRCVGNRDHFCRAGYRFTRLWTPLSPAPTADQLLVLKAEKCIQVRILA